MSRAARARRAGSPLAANPPARAAREAKDTPDHREWLRRVCKLTEESIEELAESAANLIVNYLNREKADDGTGSTKEQQERADSK